MAQTIHSRDIFETMSVGRSLRTMAIPTIISQIIVLIYNLADTFFIGKTNNPEMVAAASLVLPVFNVCLSIAGLGSVGGGSLISRLLGKGDETEAKRVCSFSIYLSIIVAALFSLLMGVFSVPILTLLGADAHTLAYAQQYAFCVIVIGGVPTVLSNVLSNLLRSIGVSREAGLGITFGGLINIALDPLFMFVLLPRGSEVLGAGIATCISNCLVCLYFIGIMVKIRKHSVLTFRPSVGRPSARSIRSIFGVGVPSALGTLLFDLDYIVIDKLMVGYGNVALASIGIVLKAERLPLNVGIGLCQGMMPLVAYSYAAGNYKRMNDTICYARLTGLLTAAVSIVLYELLAPSIMRLFILDAGTIALGTDFLRVRVLATPFMFLSFFTVYLFQAFGEGRTSLFLGVMRWLMLNIPMLFFLNAMVGMYGIVWSQITADVINVGISLVVYTRYKRHLSALRSKTDS